MNINNIQLLCNMALELYSESVFPPIHRVSHKMNTHTHATPTRKSFLIRAFLFVEFRIERRTISLDCQPCQSHHRRTTRKHAHICFQHFCLLLHRLLYFRFNCFFSFFSSLSNIYIHVHVFISTFVPCQQSKTLRKREKGETRQQKKKLEEKQTKFSLSLIESETKKK